jgi:hypothetical protein
MRSRALAKQALAQGRVKGNTHLQGHLPDIKHQEKQNMNFFVYLVRPDRYPQGITECPAIWQREIPPDKVPSRYTRNFCQSMLCSDNSRWNQKFISICKGGIHFVVKPKW